VSTRVDTAVEALVLPIGAPIADATATVGGKGANLGALTERGLAVPPGFCITVDAHARFLAESRAGDQVETLAEAIDPTDPQGLERVCAEIRALLLETPLPSDVEASIIDAYKVLGQDQDCYVAVRSSGIAEDSAAASFAGLHDTSLDVRGAEDVLTAVRECWASAWSSRAASYRTERGLTTADAAMGVVVQQMVESAAAGVMFTANPLTAATDEIVVNANWGLGESVVSGQVTPDTFVIASSDLRVKERRIGEKATRIVRAATGRGTVEEDVPAPDRERASLTDEQVVELGRLGRLIQHHYDGLPQDVEWALADGTLHVLQSRPITGVEFAWEADLDRWQTKPVDDDALWTRRWGDDYQSGAVSPLFYTIRQYTCTHANWTWANLLGADHANLRNFKFYKSTVYFNCEVDRVLLRDTTPPMIRPGLADMIPPSWQPEVFAEKFNYLDYLKQHARVETTGNGLLKWFKVMENYMQNEIEAADGVPDEQLRLMDDIALRAFCDGFVEYERKYLEDAWTGFMTHAKEMMSLLGMLLMKWYPDATPALFGRAVAGSVSTTATQVENQHLWNISRTIRRSSELRELFERRPGAEFFTALAAHDSDDAREAAAQYAALMQESGHRGSSDRDMAFPSRRDDQSADHAALTALIAAEDDADPERREREVNAGREQLMDEITAAIRRQPLGALKAEAIRSVHAWVMRFNAIRDDERHFFDRFMYTTRRGFLEVGRRLTERGVFTEPDEVFFLGREELWDVFTTGRRTPLVSAKIATRRRDFERFDRKEYMPPEYLQHGRPANAVAGLTESAGGDTPIGLPVSGGTVTGTARVIRSLHDIGRVGTGEILVVNATDPAWTSAFLIVSGIVVETGGMLSHAACLAREYGLPAVQLSGAIQWIEDGSTITVDGDTGVISVVEPAATETAVV
jgi:rifampicin phosphotransferase